MPAGTSWDRRVIAFVRAGSRGSSSANSAWVIWPEALGDRLGISATPLTHCSYTSFAFSNYLRNIISRDHSTRRRNDEHDGIHAGSGVRPGLQSADPAFASNRHPDRADDPADGARPSQRSAADHPGWRVRAERAPLAAGDIRGDQLDPQSAGGRGGDPRPRATPRGGCRRRAAPGNRGSGSQGSARAAPQVAVAGGLSSPLLRPDRRFVDDRLHPRGAAPPGVRAAKEKLTMATQISALSTTSSRKAGKSLGLALIVIAVAQLMVVLDTAIVNIALPSIQRALHFTPTGLEWVVNGYALAFGGLLLLGGRAGDLFGRRRVFVAGVILFTLGSLAGGFATTSSWLIAARVVQGIGGAIVAPTALSLVAVMFPEGAQRK